ncbi:MAG: tetratricopeptide repeat protein [Phocaeicola sp.]
MVYHSLLSFFLLLGLFATTACQSTPSSATDAPQHTSEHTSQHTDTLVTYAQKQLQQARSLQQQAKYAESIEKYQHCIQIDTPHESLRDALQPLVIESLLQLLNSHQSQGTPDSCVAYLTALSQAPTSLIQSHCQRDLYALLGYALSRTEAMDLAEQTTLQALSLPLVHSTPQRLFRDYAYAAAVFFSNPNQQEQVIQWCLLAIEQAQLYNNPSGKQWLYSILGTLYKRTGKISEAADLFLQSIEHSRHLGDILGELNAYNALSELYLYWQLPTYANQYATSSLHQIEQIAHSSPMVAAQTYLRKAQVMVAMQQPDSAIHFLQKADEYGKNLPYNSGLVDIDCLLGSILVNYSLADSLALGMERLQRAATQATSLNRAKAYYQLAQGYLKQQQRQPAEAMLDSMYHLLNLSATPLYIEEANEFALAHYLKQGNAPRIKQYAKALLAENEVLNDKQTSQKLAATIVQFQTEKRTQQLHLAQAKLENNKLTIRFYIFTFFSSTLILLLLLLYNRKVYRIKQRMGNQELDSLLDKLELAQLHNSQVQEQLSTLFTEKESRKEIEALTPKLLKEKGESTFRERFEQLYPHFLPHLRQQVPNLGRKEELLAMLIALGQDSHQIATHMGIAHRSVNMARYRLRQKLQLEKEESLELVIANGCSFLLS